MFTLFRSLVCLTLWLSVFLVKGQTSPSLHFGVAEGLPSSEVYKVYQDKKGFIWFATDNGIVRYDGKEMDQYQLSEGLSDPVVFDFFEDHLNRLWFRTLSGRLSYFEDEQIHSYEYNDTLASICRGDFMQSFAIDDQENVWFGLRRGWGIISSEGVIKFKKNDTEHHLEFKETEVGLISSHSGANKEIRYITLNDRNLPIKADGLNNHEIICIVTLNGDSYFSLGSDIFKLNGEKITQVFKGRDQIISLSIDKQKQIWIGYFQSGVDLCNELWLSLEVHLPFIQSLGVTHILQDKQGGYWITTLQDGAYYVPELDYTLLAPPVHAKIMAATSWHDKALIGDDVGNLLLLNRAGDAIWHYTIPQGIILQITSSENSFWISSTRGTFLFDEFLKAKKINKNVPGGLCSDAISDVWAMRGNQVIHYGKDGELLGSFNTEKIYRQIFCTKTHILTFGRIGIDAFTFPPFQKKINLPHYFDKVKVSKVISIDDSTILIGTLGSGFSIVNAKKWSLKNTFSKTNFNANNIYDCIIVNDQLWLATEKGIAIASVKSFSTSTSPSFTFITKKNGLMNDRVNSLTAGSDQVWAYSDNAICTIPLSSLEHLYNRLTSPCYLQKVLVNNSLFHRNSNLDLTSTQNNLQFVCRFIDFKNQNIFFRHRIAHSDSWSYSNERSIKYYSLSSGKYSFELEYSYDNRLWKKGQSINFTIHPPLWRAWYFQVPLLSLISIVGIVYYRRRINRLRERQNYLTIINAQQKNLIQAELATMERERNRIAKELHDSIGTNLSAIKMTVRGLMLKYNEPKSDEVEKDLQQTIQEIKDIIYELVPAGLTTYGLAEITKGYAKKIKENLGLDIEVQCFGPELKDQTIGLTAFRILQELLSNSLKHSQAKKVIIALNVFDDLLNVIYQDDGKGFDVDAVKKGSGLLNIQSRVQSLNGNMKFESSAHGVFYSIDLPLKKKI